MPVIYSAQASPLLCIAFLVDYYVTLILLYFLRMCTVCRDHVTCQTAIFSTSLQHGSGEVCQGIFSEYDVPVELFFGCKCVSTYCTPKVGTHDYSGNAVWIIRHSWTKHFNSSVVVIKLSVIKYIVHICRHVKYNDTKRHSSIYNGRSKESEWELEKWQLSMHCHLRPPVSPVVLGFTHEL